MTRESERTRESAGPRFERGVAAVEFVVTAPFLVFLMLAVAEVGRALVHYSTLSYGVRDSARFVTEHSIHEPRSGMTRQPCSGRSPSCTSTRKSTPGERWS